MTKSELKRKLKTIVNKWVRRFGLDPQWKIKIHIAPESDIEEEYINSQVICDPIYYRAEFLFSPEHYKKDYDKICCHETLHILLSPLRHFVLQVLLTDELVENQNNSYNELATNLKNKQKQLERLWCREEENVVERLQDAFLRAYRKNP